MPSSSSSVMRMTWIIALAAGALLAAYFTGRALLAESDPEPLAAPASSAAVPATLPATAEPTPPPALTPPPVDSAPKPAPRRLAEDAAVWGLVVDPRGAPVAGASIWMHPRRDELAAREGTEPPPILEPEDSFAQVWSTKGVHVEADERGNYDSGLLDAGTWLLCVAPPGDKWAPSAREVTLAEGDERELNLSVDQAAFVRGQIVDVPGMKALCASVQVIEVGLAPGVRRTFDLKVTDGSFTVHVAPTAELLVRSADADGRVTGLRHVDAGALEFTLTLNDLIDR